MKKSRLIALFPFLLAACQDPVTPEIILEGTANKIAEIRPTGKLQVLTSLMEAYAKDEIRQAFLSKSYIQIVRERCSFNVDLTKVKYQPVLGSNVVQVEMVYPEAECLLQSAPFMSDDEEFWMTHLPLDRANKVKAGLHLQNLQQFATPENRLKAQKYGEDFVRRMLENIGFMAEISWVKEAPPTDEDLQPSQQN